MTAPEAPVLTPRAIVAELSRYVVGQEAAKRCVAIALRNRYRRQRVSGEMRDEILPHNILMIGPTGVGKTEIARRLARLAQAPFLKVEASKYTEVGYVGRDVESMVRDLVELSVGMVRASHAKLVQERAEERAEDRILTILLPRPRRRRPEPAGEPRDEGGDTEPPAERYRRSRERMKDLLRAGKLDERLIEIESDVPSRQGPVTGFFAHLGVDEADAPLADAFESLFPKRRRKRTVSVAEARTLLRQEETNRLIDMDRVVAEGLERAQQDGIIFLDEIDKIVGSHAGSGPEVSREGVQRDLLPIIEGSTVTTRYGPVATSHILFIAAGAFHHARPSDLIPELQGRLPIRVELSSLTEADFVRILTEPRNALLEQYKALLQADGVQIEFPPDAVRVIARMAAEANAATEDIGARRLHTILAALLEDVLFEAPEGRSGTIVFDSATVEARLRPIVRDKDLSRYIL